MRSMVEGLVVSLNQFVTPANAGVQTAPYHVHRHCEDPGECRGTRQSSAAWD